MNRKAKILLIYASGVTCLLALTYLLVWSHDVSLWQLSRSLTSVKHPPNTNRVAFMKNLGLLVANGNHSDYFVAEMRSYSSNLSPRAIERFYQGTNIWNPLNRRHERVSVGVIENGRIRSNEDLTEAGDFLKHYFKPFLPRTLTNQKIYFVFFLDVGNGTGCDIRCW
ncbi:MAG TPA: hypothetical protein VF600_06515 [Abditibacteriaceae bacterium]|jgi:hypothetical protein